MNYVKRYQHRIRSEGIRQWGLNVITARRDAEGRLRFGGRIGEHRNCQMRDRVGTQCVKDGTSFTRPRKPGRASPTGLTSHETTQPITDLVSIAVSLPFRE
jgi:hypothetical protein